MFILTWTTIDGKPISDIFTKRTKAKRFINEELAMENKDFIKLYQLDADNNALIEIKI